MSDIATLRPGLLVRARTTVKGNVKYKTLELEQDHITAEGEGRARWETERTTKDPAEQARASKVRSAARSKIQSACVKAGDFGLMCPTEREERLRQAVREARQLAEDFNATATWTYVGVTVMIGRVSADDVEAVRAINEQVRDFVDAMRDGVKNLDPQAIRKAANEARTLGKMLEPNASERVSKAIEVARKVARDIVKAGEGAAVEVDNVAIQRLEEARISFLDLDDAAPVEASEGEGRGVDLDDDLPFEGYSATPRQLDL
jgi:hypothetical protein